MVGLSEVAGWTLACACVFTFGGCAPTATQDSTNVEQFTSIEDIDPLLGAYDLAVDRTGGEPLHRLLRPAPVGLTLSYDVGLRHEGADGRSQGLTAVLDVAVLISAADGSATQVEGSWHSVAGWTGNSMTPDDVLTRDLSGLEGSTMTWWIDTSRMASQIEHSVDLDDFGFVAQALVLELLEAPVLLSRPIPPISLGVGGEWSGTIRSDDGSLLAYEGNITMSHPEGYAIEFPFDTGAEVGSISISGTPGSPFADERRLEVTDSTGTTAALTLKVR